MSNNPLRQVKVTICDKEYEITPDWRFIASVEAATGKGMMALINELSSVTMSISAAVTILYHGCRPKGGPDLNEVGEYVTYVGLEQFIPALTEILSLSLLGHKESVEISDPTPDGNKKEKEKE